jgi:glycosyltransferase involved in cell wall biosynthesis
VEKGPLPPPLTQGHFTMADAPHFRHTTLWGAGRLRDALREFDPHIALLTAPTHGPGYLLMKHLPAHCRVASFFSDQWSHRRSWGLPFTLTKKPWYRRVHRRSSIVYPATEQTMDIMRMISPELTSRIRLSGILIDGDDLLGTPVGAPVGLEKFSVDYPRILAVVTRPAPIKRLPEYLQPILDHLARLPDVGLVLGGLDSGASSEELRRFVANHAASKQVLVLPLLNLEQIAAVFRLAVGSIWPYTTIGVQQSIAFGCPVLLPEREPAHYLVKNGLNGFFHATDGTDIVSRLDLLLNHGWDRAQIRDSIVPFRCERFLPSLIEELLSSV